MDNNTKKAVLNSFMRALCSHPDFKFSEKDIKESLFQATEQIRLSGANATPNEYLRAIKNNIEGFSASVALQIDDAIGDNRKARKTNELPKHDPIQGFKDYELTKSKLHELMCDKSTGVNIGLNKILDLGKTNKIESIITNERGDRKFSVKSAILWARKHDKKIYRVMLKKLKLKEE